jgi:adenine-specific DNA methylase
MGFERNFNETQVARIAAREKQMQQHFRPVIGVHKWFARRPGSLFRAALLAEFAEGDVAQSICESHELKGTCLDPFMGGGSPLFEAARLGLDVIGFDTNPVARWIVERELEDLDPDALRAAGERVCDDVEADLGDLYRTTCPDCGGDAVARYSCWVRHHLCVCGHQHPLLADTLVVSHKLGRSEADLHLCPKCLALETRAPGEPFGTCSACGAADADGLVPSGSLMVCSCGEPYRIPPQGELALPLHVLAFLEVDCAQCGKERRFKAAAADDRDRAASASVRLASIDSPFIPDDAIPDGQETARLLRWGHPSWRSLFGDRQLLGLHLLAERINKEPDAPVRRALQTAFSDLLRFQNLLVRYDRQALKPTDIFAVHGFPVPRVSCEPALLGVRGVGSGGFRHILAKYERAKRWCRVPYETVPGADERLTRHETDEEFIASRIVESVDALDGQRAALLVRGSLAAHELPADSTDAVLTDPPYYANVQYAELMDFCYAWLRRLADAPYFTLQHTKTDEDAVAERNGPDGAVRFTQQLSDIYVRAAHALRDGGLFAFTYHHNNLAAYAPLIVACLDAGLVPTRILACPSEMRASTHIRGRDAATLDAVFVLRKPPLRHAAAIAPTAAPSALAGARVRAMRKAGLTPTSADRRCLRHSAEAVVAMASIAPRWDTELPTDKRLDRVLEALGLKLAPTVVAT